MSTTLTNGLKLPDKGSVDWYADMQHNYAILDGAVGTVAEHTTQIAGKAPAVHTHTKSDITDFPVYGNTAGTICEGNDSRLSDARTPVAHTHTKSDITDLLNSNFIPSANNSYDLGSSSYQWNNLYAKNYYYNGTPWGLDKANAWGNTQYVSGGNDKGWNVINSEIEKGVIPSTAKSSFVWWSDKNNTYLGRICSRVNTDGTTILWLSSLNYYKNGALDPTGNSLTTSLILAVDAIGYKFIQLNADFRPDTNNAYNLGTSTYKWKSLNGVNPGALSLPSENASSVNLDPTNWNTTGTNYNAYIPPSDGWLAIQVQSADVSDLTGQYVFIGRSTGGNDFYPQAMLSNLVGDFTSNKLNGAVMMPVISGKTYHIRVKIGKTQQEGSVILVRFYPCQGNV